MHIWDKSRLFFQPLMWLADYLGIAMAQSQIARAFLAHDFGFSFRRP